MTDDLVKRLREIGEGDMYLAPTSTKAIIDIAADRIEELEAALRYYAKGYENPFGDDDSLIARKALEERR